MVILWVFDTAPPASTRYNASCFTRASRPPKTWPSTPRRMGTRSSSAPSRSVSTSVALSGAAGLTVASTTSRLPCSSSVSPGRTSISSAGTGAVAGSAGAVAATVGTPTCGSTVSSQIQAAAQRAAAAARVKAARRRAGRATVVGQACTAALAAASARRRWRRKSGSSLSRCSTAVSSRALSSGCRASIKRAISVSLQRRRRIHNCSPRAARASAPARPGTSGEALGPRCGRDSARAAAAKAATSSSRAVACRRHCSRRSARTSSSFW